MELTIKGINSFLSENFPQIELKRYKGGFYLSGGRSSLRQTWKKLSDIDIEELQKIALAQSFTVDELNSNLEHIDNDIENERRNLESLLTQKKPLDSSAFNALAYDRLDTLKGIAALTAKDCF